VSRRLRLAYVSPLPPERSGIADYSAELLPDLAAHAEVELFYDGRAAPAGELAAHFSIQRAGELPRRQREQPFDFAVYQLGNSAAHHERTYRLIHELPGVVVLHEYVLHHLIRELTVARGDFASYLETLRYCNGATGLAAGRRAVEAGHPIDPWAFPLFERIVDASLGVLVHSEFARRRILRSRPRARVGVVPFPCTVPAGEERDAPALRRALGLPPAAPVLASFGLITPQKHLEPALRAFARLRQRWPDAVFALVGEVSPYYDLARLLAGERGVGVRLVGRVGLDRFHDFMRTADLAINLRHPTGGETSASLLRLLGLGKPTIVTAAGSFLELPDGCVAKVAADEAEEEILFALCERLLAEPELARALGENSRRYAAEFHAPERSAAAYLDFLSEMERARPAVVEPVPPLAPFPPEALEVRLAASLAADFADLGLAGEPEDLLAAVAERLVELDLDPAWASRRGGSPA